MCGSAQLSPSVPGSAQLSPSMHGNARVSPSLPGSAQLSPSVCGSAQLSPSMPKSAQLIPSVFCSSEVCSFGKGVGASLGSQSVSLLPTPGTGSEAVTLRMTHSPRSQAFLHGHLPDPEPRPSQPQARALRPQSQEHCIPQAPTCQYMSPLLRRASAPTSAVTCWCWRWCAWPGLTGAPAALSAD